MLCIWREKQITGVVCVDTESNKFYLEEFHQKSYDQLCEIRTIINRYRPVEVVIKKGDDEVRKMAKQICHPYAVEV
jgi:DNA mismatch repair ATPase MutS